MSMPLERVFDKLRQAVLDVPLGQVNRSEFQQAIEAPSFELGAGAITLTADASTDFTLLILNEERDPDSDGVFAKNIVGPDGEILPPHIRFADQQAWLKYKFTGTLKGAAQTGFLGAAIGASAKVALSDYRRHDAAKNALSALDDDRGRGVRTILKLDDVKALREGEALALQVAGELSASVKFSWSDALALSMSKLTSLVPGVPLTVNLESGLSISAKVTVDDDFVVVISRTTGGLLRVAVKKADSRTAGVTISASLGAGVEAIADRQKAIDGVVDAIIARAPVGGAQLEKLKKDVGEKLDALAKLKASIGFAYEYQRVSSNTAILDYTLATDALMDEDHGPAIHGDFALLTERVIEGNGRTLLRFLNEHKITRTSSLGFSLGLGAWKVSFRDADTLEMTERRNMAGTARMLAVKGARSYTEPRLPNNDFTWVVDLRADMDRFSARPTTKDFDYGLSYLATFERARLDAEDVAHFADFAATWRVCATFDRNAIERELESAIGKEARVDFQLIFKHDDKDEESVLVKTFDGIPSRDTTAWAAALAAAMPWDRKLPLRRDVVERTKAYTRLWQIFLTATDQISIADWKATIEDHIPGFADSTVEPGLSFLWFVTDGFRHARRHLSDFVSGAQQLGRCITEEHRDPNEIRDAYRLLSGFWTQRPYITASGVYLLNRAEKSGVLARVERTMTVTAGERTLTVSS